MSLLRSKCNLVRKGRLFKQSPFLLSVSCYMSGYSLTRALVRVVDCLWGYCLSVGLAVHGVHYGVVSVVTVL